MALTDLLARFARGMTRRFAALRFKPRLEVTPNRDLKLVRLGSGYGGWTFAETRDLQHARIVSCGLGEDASFDIEFASRYGAGVVLVDPTPRAIAHFDAITSRLGTAAETAYVSGGRQSPSSYDLSAVTAAQLTLVRKAVWTESTTLRFFKPRDPAHVSHSAVNLPNAFADTGDHILVEADKLSAILAELELNDPPLIKLDIEGAETRVIPELIEAGITPRQLLVEYDEMSLPSAETRERVEGVHQLLLQNGYALIHHDAPTNFLYLR